MWLWRNPNTSASFSVSSSPSKRSPHSVTTTWWASWCPLPATLPHSGTVRSCSGLSPTTLFSSPLPRPRSFPVLTAESSSAYSTPYSSPAQDNTVQWFCNVLLLHEVYKTCFLSKAETDFLEMNVIKMSAEAIQSPEMKKMQTGFNPHVVGSPKLP